MSKNVADDTGMIRAEVDERITYPCYKSLDEFIDVDRLAALDSYITEGIERHLRAQADALFMNTFRLDESAPEAPGQKMIQLTQSERPFNYYDLNHTELWHAAGEAQEFSMLMDFIATLPFKATGRMLIMYDAAPRAVPAHRDHLDTNICHEFIWFRTNLKKPFYVLNHMTGEKKYVESYSAWFDTVNQFHGSDPCDGLSFSIRVDGHFTDEFRNRIPTPAYNAASTPALWANISHPFQ
ncbi:MAG: hypothetical protein ICV60_21900 [Pyrinomonadaceae bacterium]|nr:hypothetical protein [Pyrinomonadaceae bacterium]